ncbi:SAM-dependent methyltransferase SMT-type [Trema orientale]|uniref:SAM-dependent methyltransferase SMT-type n=1 Tax=Trema orientale TaxID=63057 RepID=A0A2P5AHX7_TREOI|nr:SAM-dependent methyltransferase SMT-type [Trema orientale]
MSSNNRAWPAGLMCGGYEKYHVCYGGEEEERKANYSDMVNKYYDLVTSFYEFGWGESFHFAPRWKGESLRESIKRHEHFLALQLGVKPGQKVLDVGCGIGGPLREFARFSSASVTGLNNNEYQISRGKELNRIAGVDKTCDFVKAEIEIGDGLPDIRLTTKCLEALKQAGFEVIWEKDLAADSPIPWYLPLDKSHFSLSSFRLTAVGRFFTKNMVKALEFVGLAPKGSQRVQDFLEKAAEGLVEGGKKEIFTPMYFFLVRKPENAISKKAATGHLAPAVSLLRRTMHLCNSVIVTKPLRDMGQLAPPESLLR